MKQPLLYKALLASFFGGLFFVGFGTLAAHGASPLVFISWKAQSYVPANFQGKVLPTASSSFAASVEVIDNGKLADLSKQTIYWYADDEFLGGSAGAQAITFSGPATSPNLLNLRVQVPGYPGGTLIKTVEIPIMDPEVVIVSPYPAHVFSSSPATVAVRPYFFHANDLSGLTINWLLNGAPPENPVNPQILTITADVQPETTIPVSVSVVNANDFLDSASADTFLIF